MVSSVHSKLLYNLVHGKLLYKLVIAGLICNISFLQKSHNNNDQFALTKTKKSFDGKGVTTNKAVRYLAFGTSVTWGSTLPEEDRLDLAYPYLLGEDVKNAAVRAAGGNYPSICTESLIGHDAVYDVIVLEFFRRYSDEGEGLEKLSRRLRERFPDALMIFVQDWYLNMIGYYDPKLKRSVRVKEWSESNNYGSTPTSPTFIEKFNDDKSIKWQSKWNFDKKEKEYRAIAESVGGHVVELPRPDSFANITNYVDLFADDWMHLSSRGHEVIAQRVKEVVKEIGIVEQEPRINEWTYHDDCHLWLDTGKVPYSIDGRAFIEKFDERGKYSLTFPHQSSDDGKSAHNEESGKINLVNEYDQPLKLYLTFMTTGPSPSMYPKTKVLVVQNGRANNSSSSKGGGEGKDYSVVVDPEIEWSAQLAHLLLTRYIGVVLPGEFTLEFQSLEEEKEQPFRLVSVALNGDEVSSEDDKTSFLIGT